MKKKLKTWKAFVAEFKPIADKWDEDEYGYFINIYYNNVEWTINTDMQKLFGTEIKVRELNYNSKSYTYSDSILGCNWHELWFEPEFEEIEFISKEEVEI